jgi:hypothetical protein
LALDEPKSDDQRIDHQGVSFVIGNELRIWLRLGREVQVSYHPDDERFSVRLNGPSCC